MNYKEERKKDAETPGGHIYELIEKNYVVDKNAGKDYVFISYSSKDWKQVLYEIVYNTCKDYGLRVYFDTKFDVGSDSWLTQFQKNMNSEHCKAVLAFVSPNYKTSYATLMELMSSQETSNSRKIPVLPIILANYNVDDYSNTGLGTERFADNSTNDLWKKELELFNKLFLAIVDDPKNHTIKDVPRAKNVLYTKSSIHSSEYEPYSEELNFDALKGNLKFWEDHGIDFHDENRKRSYWESISGAVKEEKGEKYLNRHNNFELVSEILSNLDKNNIDGVNKDISKAIYDKLCDKEGINAGSVFFDDLTGTSDKNSRRNGKISGPTSLFGSLQVKKGKKAKLMLIQEMILNKILNPTDEVYVKGHKSEIGQLTDSGDVLYHNQVFSLNKFVPEILGPGNRSAYDFVIHKPSEKTLSDLRLEYTSKNDCGTETNVIEVKKETEEESKSKESNEKQVVKAKKESLKEMVNSGKVSAGDEVYVKGHEAECGELTSTGEVIYMSDTFSLNQYVIRILGHGNYNAYTHVYHKKSGKLLDYLR